MISTQFPFRHAIAELAAAAGLIAASEAFAASVFGEGTVFVVPDLVTAADPSGFRGLSDAGTGSRLMFDRRVNPWVTYDAWLFDAAFVQGPTVEIQVNPEFSTVEAARDLARFYARIIEQMPAVLLQDLDTVSIHDGVQPFGGGNRNLLIHTGQGDLYATDGVLEEVLIHEAAHTSLDAYHATAPDWLAAQGSDPFFISSYAESFPDREDVAETFLMYLAARSGLYAQIDPELVAMIENGIPDRLDYFDARQMDLTTNVPLPASGWLFATALAGAAGIRRRTRQSV